MRLLRYIWTPPMAHREPVLFALIVGFGWGVLAASLIERLA